MKKIGIILPIGKEEKSVLGQEYVRAVERSGGMAIALPCTENATIIDNFAALCDGFIFAGGEDVSPALYGEEITELCGEVIPQRDRFETLAFQRLFLTKKPILGICRGMQLINVLCGGSLYQDINASLQTDIAHRQTQPHSMTSHTVTIAHGTPFYGALDEEKIPVNSWHHQGIRTLGEGLSVMATADDGVIEAFYMPGRRYLCGVQWHPERCFDEEAHSRAIFKHFLLCCKEE